MFGQGPNAQIHHLTAHFQKHIGRLDINRADYRTQPAKTAFIGKNTIGRGGNLIIVGYLLWLTMTPQERAFPLTEITIYTVFRDRGEFFF
jgi:hypothetical protein